MSCRTGFPTGYQVTDSHTHDASYQEPETFPSLGADLIPEGHVFGSPYPWHQDALEGTRLATSWRPAVVQRDYVRPYTANGGRTLMPGGTMLHLRQPGAFTSVEPAVYRDADHALPAERELSSLKAQVATLQSNASAPIEHVDDVARRSLVAERSLREKSDAELRASLQATQAKIDALVLQPNPVE